MKKIISFLFILSLSFSNICFSQWIQQNSGTTKTLRSTRFKNNETGWAVGDTGTIVKTTNSGNNWFFQTSGNFRTLSSIFTIDGTILWIVGELGTILKSTNGGNNWISKPSGVTSDLHNVYFQNSDVGWSAGWFYILKSTDGGESWSTKLHGDLYVWSIYFFDLNTGVAVGQYFIRRSTDGGESWVNILYDYFWMGSVSFTDANTGLAVGFFGPYQNSSAYTLRTTNSGVSWNGHFHYGKPIFNSVFFVDQNSGWISGDSGTILKSTNGGNTWAEQSSGIITRLTSICFVNPYIGWVVGDNGIILKTTNGGEPVGIKPNNKDIPQSFSLSQNYPNPFNPVTKIKYQIPLSRGVSAGRGVLVRLIIYDILGREIVTLINETQKLGSYEVTWDGNRYASGVYFYRLYVDDASAPLSITKKMVLIK